MARAQAVRVARGLKNLIGQDVARFLVSTAIDDALVSKAAKDPDAFIRYVARDSEGKPFDQQPFHTEIQRFIPPPGNHWRGLVCLPRLHGKTDQGLNRIVYELGRKPTLRIKVVTETDELAEKVLSAIKGLIESSEQVHRVFPHLRPGSPWGSTQIRVRGTQIGEKEYSVQATSITSSITGGRADFIHFDDVCGFENSVAKPAVREKIKESFQRTWMNLLEPNGRAVYYYTPWHQEDLSSYLASNPTWNKLIHPAIYTKGGKRYSLWPSKWPLERLDTHREIIGHRAFAQQFMLVPLADEDIIFGDDVLSPCMCPGFVYGSKDYYEFTRNMPKVLGADVGASLGSKSSFTVLMTVGIGDDGRLWVVDIDRGRMKPNAIAPSIIEKWKQYAHSMVVVENNGFQSMIQQQLEDALGEMALRIPVMGFTTTRSNKQSLEIGVRGMSSVMSRGGWAIPVGGLGGRFDPKSPVGILSWPRGEIETNPIAVFIKELVEYGSGGYSDTVMAAWLANHAANWTTVSSGLALSSAYVG